MTLQPQPIFHNFSHRNELGAFLSERGLVGKGVEVGVLYGAYSAEILKTWKGHLYCVDPWINQPTADYFDGANLQDMNHVFAAFQNSIGRHPRCTAYRMMSLNAVGKFEDGELDFVYLDGNHRLSAIRDDIAAWWPKVKIGGIFSGHDYFTRYDKDTDSDALTAVAELAEALGIRAHVTWCSSWWFEKTEEADKVFRYACVQGYLPRPVYTDNGVARPVMLDNGERGVAMCDMSCVVVLPVAKFDWNLTMKWLDWWAAMESTAAEVCAKPLLVWASPELTEGQVKALKIVAATITGTSRVEVASSVREMGYFGSCNQMLRTALEYCEREFPGRAVLWCEADTVPMRATWVDEIMAEYRACGRPFMGDVERGGGIPHLTGNAVYHPEWRKLAPSLAALGQEACGWDSLCAHDILPRAHVAKTIQQTWRPPLPITADWAAKNIRPETALFHQCKDGSLIDVLCLRDGLPLIPLAPALCESTYERDRHKLAPTGPVGVTVTRQVGPVRQSGQTSILIVSCRRDIELLAYCLKSIEKYCRGFASVVLAVPAHDERHFQKFVKGIVRLVTFVEPVGKGMMMHEVVICRADEMCPEADVILHVDSDCLFWRETKPEDYLPGGRCLMVRESYAEIAPRNPNRLIWGRCVEAATGIVPEWETMVRHPNIFLRAIYPHLRAVVEGHVKRGFDEYVLSCENGFPQGFAEFPTLGAVAIRDMADKFSFVHYDHGLDGRECGLPAGANYQYVYRPERDHMVEGWSHGGLGRYKADWDKFLAGQLPKYYVK